MLLAAAVQWSSLFFLLFALLACGFALAVVLTSNVVRMAFYLVLSLGATAGLFFLAGAEFVGAMQLMIYVGGTLVLLVFGVMLTAQQSFIHMKTSGGDWIMAAIVAGSLLVLLVSSALSVGDWTTPHPNPAVVTLAEAETTARIGAAITGFRPETLEDSADPLHAGRSGYLLLFEIMAIHLLVVLVGAAYLARSKRRSRGV